MPQEKYIDKIKIGTSSICWLFFMKKAPPTFCLMNIIFFGKKQNLYRWGTKRWRRFPIFLFVSNIQKKTFHTKTNFGSKSVCINQILLKQWFLLFFEPKLVFVWNVFFCMFETKRKIGKRLQRFVPHLYRFCFLPKKIIFMRQKVGGFFHEK